MSDLMQSAEHVELSFCLAAIVACGASPWKSAITTSFEGAVAPEQDSAMDCEPHRDAA